LGFKKRAKGAVVVVVVVGLLVRLALNTSNQGTEEYIIITTII